MAGAPFPACLLALLLSIPQAPGPLLAQEKNDEYFGDVSLGNPF